MAGHDIPEVFTVRLTCNAPKLQREVQSDHIQLQALLDDLSKGSNSVVSAFLAIDSVGRIRVDSTASLHDFISSTA